MQVRVLFLDFDIGAGCLLEPEYNVPKCRVASGLVDGYMCMQL